MKTRFFGLLVAFIVYGSLGNAQAVKHPVAAEPSAMSDLGVFEPPEMKTTITVTPTPTPSAADLAFYDALKQFGKKDYDPASLPILDRFIQDVPTYASAYFWRASTEACGDKPLDLVKAKIDFESALSHWDKDHSLFDRKDVYSLLARIEDANGNHTTAISLLEKAMMLDLSSADKIFNIEGVSPQTTSRFCTWNLTSLHKLATSSPKDWRPVVFEGLYYKFFTSFDESYYPQAAAALQSAALLNPRTPTFPTCRANST